MANHTFRSAVVLVLLLGTLALAVPYVSSVVDAWLFSEGPEPARPKWNTQRPNAEKALQPAGGQRQPVVKQLGHEESLEAIDPMSAVPLEEVATPRLLEYPSDVNSTAPPRPADESGSIAALQQEFEDLGAAYLTVEREGDRFECRSLVPLSSQSSYQKPFSAVGSTPEAALEQVLAEVRNWQRAQQQRR